GIYVALDPEEVWAKVTGRGALASGNAVIIAAAALVILGLINVLGSRYETKLDLTANQQYTLSDQSIKVAQAVPEPVKVTAWSSSNAHRRRRTSRPATASARSTASVRPTTAPSRRHWSGTTSRLRRSICSRRARCPTMPPKSLSLGPPIHSWPRKKTR